MAVSESPPGQEPILSFRCGWMRFDKALAAEPLFAVHAAPHPLRPRKSGLCRSIAPPGFMTLIAPKRGGFTSEFQRLRHARLSGLVSALRLFILLSNPLHRRAPPAFLTAMPNAFTSPTRTTSFRPRVMPV